MPATRNLALWGLGVGPTSPQEEKPHPLPCSLLLGFSVGAVAGSSCRCPRVLPWEWGLNRAGFQNISHHFPVYVPVCYPKVVRLIKTGLYPAQMGGGFGCSGSWRKFPWGRGQPRISLSGASSCPGSPRSSLSSAVGLVFSRFPGSTAVLLQLECQRESLLIWMHFEESWGSEANTE